MDFQRLEIAGPVIVTPRLFEDDRGFFMESYNQREFEANGIVARFVQDNHSRSKRGSFAASIFNGLRTPKTNSFGSRAARCSTSPLIFGRVLPRSGGGSVRRSPKRTAACCSSRKDSRMGSLRVRKGRNSSIKFRIFTMPHRTAVLRGTIRISASIGVSTVRCAPRKMRYCLR